MKKHCISLLGLALFSAYLTSCESNDSVKLVEFDGTKEVSGERFALRDINPALPTDWTDYQFVVIEYKISTAQRFQLGFHTKYGYNELRVMSYVPNAWNKLAIPMRFFTELPDPKVDLAATFNQPRYTGWINLGGQRGPMEGVDSIGVRIRRAIGSPSMEIRSITLEKDDPGDTYLEATPAIDVFGQHVDVDYPEKIHSLEQLQAEWRQEEEEVVDPHAYQYTKFGGYRQQRVHATGYFHTALIDGRWWFVDPEGYLFLSVGVDCVSAGGGGNIRAYDQRPSMYEELPPQSLAQSGRQPSFGQWNQYRRFGESYVTKSKELIFKRMDK